MKIFVRIGLLSLALGAAGLLAGCASHRSTATTLRRASDFEVVETSSKRLLTAQEMVQLRAAVASYLVKEGVVGDGDYYVKVYLTPDQDGVPAEWVVVRFTKDTDLRFSLVASYPAHSSGSYAAYDYYPYGYDNFGRISFQYYDDPFYGNHYYFPSRNHDRNRNHDGKHDGGKGRDHDKDDDRDRDNHSGSQDRPRFKPIPAVGSDQVARPRRDNNSSGRDSQPRGHRDAAPSQSESRPEASPATARSDHFPRHGGAPANRQADSAPERTSSQVVTRNESSRESSRSNDSSPSYNPPAARSESTQSSNSERSPRETKGTGSVFSRERPD